MQQQKYVRLKEYGQIIIFPCIIQHSKFKSFNPITAGFCYIDNQKIKCFGESISLDLKSDPEKDTILATKQIFGVDAFLDLIKNSPQSESVSGLILQTLCTCTNSELHIINGKYICSTCQKQK